MGCPVGGGTIDSGSVSNEHVLYPARQCASILAQTAQNMSDRIGGALLSDIVSAGAAIPSVSANKPLPFEAVPTYCCPFRWLESGINPARFGPAQQDEVPGQQASSDRGLFRPVSVGATKSKRG